MHRPSWDYRDISQLTQAFADTEKDGAWGIAAEIAGSLNAGGDATAATVSCATSGNCTVGGVFQDNANRHQPFVLTETAGSWGQAGRVSGSTAFTSSTETSIAALSCASAGNCVAGGSYSSGVSDDQAYVLTQTHGAWGKAALLPGLASLNQGGDASVTAISCRSAGNCSVGGSYRDKAGAFRAFVENEKNGTWTKAIPVPGLAALTATNGVKDSGVVALSCASAGHCVAGGSYHDRKNHLQAFVVSEG